MRLSEWRNIFLTIGIAIFLMASTSAIINYLPKRSEPYIAMSILGENMMIDDYYPGDNSTIMIDDPVQWNILLYNHMGEAQYLAVKVKLLSPGIASPDSTQSEPSPSPVIHELRYILLDNETLIVPFTWAIINAENINGELKISKMVINEHIHDLEVTVDDRESLRLLFELWIYDNLEETFSFNWESLGETRCVWNQLWFTLGI